MNSRLKVFACTSHPALARKICDEMGLPLGRSSAIRFSNENIKVKIEENVRGADVYVIHTSCPPVSDGFLELLITIDALKHASAERITAVLPYYPYARSDKKDEPRISITARLIADLLQTAGANRVLTMDLHSPQIQGFFRIPVDHLTATGLLCQHFATHPNIKEWVLVAPDAGEAKDAGRYAKRLYIPMAIIDKRRYHDDEQAHAEHLIGDVTNKHALIIDDEVATAGTLVETCKILHDHGVSGITFGTVHAVLSGPAMERIKSSQLTEMVITDSIPLPEFKQWDKFRVLSVAPLFAQAIKRIHGGQSVSELFNFDRQLTLGDSRTT